MLCCSTHECRAVVNANQTRKSHEQQGGTLAEADIKCLVQQAYLMQDPS